MKMTEAEIIRALPRVILVETGWIEPGVTDDFAASGSDALIQVDEALEAIGLEPSEDCAADPFTLEVLIPALGGYVRWSVDGRQRSVADRMTDDSALWPEEVPPTTLRFIRDF